MKFSEFEVGKTFLCGGKTWRCTDIGSRVVVAIEFDLRTDRTWFTGPPYAVAEHVFDEDDQGGCLVDGGETRRPPS